MKGFPVEGGSYTADSPVAQKIGRRPPARATGANPTIALPSDARAPHPRLILVTHHDPSNYSPCFPEISPAHAQRSI
jgi:hypothetical protein